MLSGKVSGVYETLRSFSGSFVFLGKHQERMARSCAALGLECPDLAGIVSEFSGQKDVRLRVAVSAEGEVEVQHFELPAWHGSFLYDEVWRVKIFDGARENPELKSTDTEMQADAREQAAREGFKEVLLVDENGFVTEGGITNVWFVDGDKIVTPDSGMLPGIGRALILEACKELGIEVEKRAVRQEELDNFDAIFLSNSIRGIIATQEGQVPEVMERIVEWCTDYIQEILLSS
jgi:branched-chain amino acid aminotransferase